MLSLVEIVSLIVVLVIAFRAPHLGVRPLRRLTRGLSWLGRRRRLAVAVVGLVSLAVAIALSLMHWPQPSVHDEFSYLLAGDTFAHGRWTNPPHPMWMHFESFHILQQPTYQSKYPPAQGLALAAGQVLGGHPLVGVWVSTALACAAICWMLFAWLPPRWAVLGGLLAALHPCILENWSQSYWGGSMAALGGALVLGAMRRLMRRPTPAMAGIMALGAAILLNSRPYEGLVILVPAIALVLREAAIQRLARPIRWRRHAIPALMVLCPVAIGMAYYNVSVTGEPTRLPYQVHEASYAAVPYYLWQSPRPVPQYHNRQFADYQLAIELRYFLEQRYPAGFLKKRAEFCWKFLTWYLRPALIVPLFAIGRAVRNRWMRIAAYICGLMFLAVFMEKWMYAHYAAPAACLFFALIVQAMRHLQLWKRRGRPTGRFLARALPIVYAAAIVPLFVTRALPANSEVWSDARARIIAQLERQGGRHLIIVHYEPQHWVHEEWVYNDADIDRSPVVWAREMSEERNAEIVEYYRDRTIWLLEADAKPPRLTPYRWISHREQRERRVPATRIDPKRDSTIRASFEPLRQTRL